MASASSVFSMQSSKYLIIFCFWALIIYCSDWQASHSDMKKGLLLIFMSSASHFSGCLFACLIVVWVCFGLFFFIHLTCNSSWVFLLPWFGHDCSFQNDVFLLLITLIPCCSATLPSFSQIFFCCVACICSQPPVWYLCVPYCLGRFNSLSFPI